MRLGSIVSIASLAPQLDVILFEWIDFPFSHVRVDAKIQTWNSTLASSHTVC